MPQPTYREIARCCGLSHSTVSRALSHDSRITDQTRAIVQLAAERMGWKPNPLAAAYMSHIRSTKKAAFRASICFLVSFEREQDYPQFQQEILAGAQAKAASLGYILDPIWFCDLSFDGRRLGKLLRSRGIAGLIIDAQNLKRKYLEGVDWNNLAVAICGMGLHDLPLHRASFYHFHGMRTMLLKLRSLGYRRIALVLSEFQDALADHAFYSEFFYEERTQTGDEWVASFPYHRIRSKSAIRKKIQDWLRKYTPEVIIGDRPVLDAIKEMKWRIPQDVAFASLFYSEAFPEIAGIYQLPRVIGENALGLVSEQLIQNMRGIPKNSKIVMNEGRWIDGPSIPTRND